MSNIEKKRKDLLYMEHELLHKKIFYIKRLPPNFRKDVYSLRPIPSEMKGNASYNQLLKIEERLEEIRDTLYRIKNIEIQRKKLAKKLAEQYL